MHAHGEQTNDAKTYNYQTRLQTAETGWFYGQIKIIKKTVGCVKERDFFFLDAVRTVFSIRVVHGPPDEYMLVKQEKRN